MHKKFLVVLLALLVLTSLGGGLASAQDGTEDRTGETVLVQGQVTDSDGNPIADAVVELWQADVNGNYDHPNDATGEQLLADFQYFGTTVTDAEDSPGVGSVGESAPHPARRTTISNSAP